MGGYPDPQHTSGLRQGLINSGLNAFAGQVIGGRKTGRSGTDDGYLFIAARQAIDFHIPRVKFIGGQTLKITNRNRGIHFTAAACLFTAVGTNSAQHAGKGQFFHYDLKGFLVLTLFHHLDIPLNIESRGAGQAAGGSVYFLDSVSPGDGLRI